ncbi:hypothetical protein ACHHYP_08153 [Achlya hypogyna]|uniref:RanBP2-type domain-containing protein n=1 Tax=Achlya hypogyna TaxID=1202772 RepID=A0A1V9ZLC6_ACHHY|nr:hypothetical protein ACHHYP_08153 [Achlya hypogyna]
MVGRIDPPVRRTHRHLKTTASPFQVESIAEYRHLTSVPSLTAPKLNVGLQYLKSILYKGESIVGSHVLRDHFNDQMRRGRSEAADAARRQEALERQKMEAVDAESRVFNELERTRLAQVLTAYLVRQKNEYLAVVGARHTHAYRDYQAVYDRSRTCNWTCSNCGTHNERFMYECEWCHESSAIQDVAVGLWELQRAGSSHCFSVGQYRIERRLSDTVGASGFALELREVPPRAWCIKPIWRRSPKDQTGLRVVFDSTQVVGVIDQEGLQIQWDDGMLWQRVQVVVGPRMPPRPKGATGSRRSTAVRETPRAVAKHLQRIDASVSLDAILLSMHQNKSADVQVTGCLAIAKSILTGQNYVHCEANVVESAATALSLHRSVVTAVYASTSVLLTLLEAADDANLRNILRCVPLLIYVLCDHAAKSVVHRGMDVLAILDERGHGGYIGLCATHVVTIPNERHATVIAALQDELKLENVTSVEARSSSIVTFRVEDGEMQPILTALQKMGVGVQYGFCDVMSLTPGTSISKRKPKIAAKSRPRRALLQRSTDVGTAIPVAEIYAHIEASTTLSRDSIGMLFISSSIAGIGLAGDSSTCVVASMLLSPLMGPILGCSFGFAIKDRNMFLNGLLNELFALVITLLLGVLIGIALAPYATDLKWPTYEMRSRGQFVQLVFGAVVAALSGAGVALAESNANVSSVVGTAIAAALLPPTVNCGICLSYAIIGPLFVKDYEVANKNVFFEIAVGSWLLLWINIIFIYLSAVCVFKIKRVDRFQLIRKVDEGAWTNLPKLGKTPRAREASYVTEDDDDEMDAHRRVSIPIDSASDSPLSPTTATKRRGRDLETSVHADAV